MLRMTQTQESNESKIFISTETMQCIVVYIAYLDTKTMPQQIWSSSYSQQMA